MGLGLALLRLRLSRPGLASLLATGWMRIGMVSSGAVFLGNVLPAAFLDWVVWNPLFHTIDHARGLAFENYAPRHSHAWTAFGFAAASVLCGALAGRIGAGKDRGGVTGVTPASRLL